MVGNFDVYANVCWNGKYPRIAIGVKCKLLKIHGSKIPSLQAIRSGNTKFMKCKVLVFSGQSSVTHCVFCNFAKNKIMKAESFSIEVKGSNPFVVLDLKKYQAMVEQIEDMKDRLAMQSRVDDEDVSWEDTEKKLIHKFDLK